MDERQRIGERIKELRSESGMTQTELAERLNIKQTSLSRIESGRFWTRLDMLSAIAEVFGKKIDFV